MLKYSLIENILTKRVNDYSAQTHSTGKYDKEAIIKRMLGRGSLLTRTDILAVLNNLEETVVNILLEGATVNMPLFNSSFSISGIFESPLDSFDPARHKVNINISKGALLRDIEKNIPCEKTNAVIPMPQIQEVKDSLTGILNKQITPKGVVEIRGYNLKIEGEDSVCGLWFINEEGDETRADIIIENKPSTLIAYIPLLANGNYQIKIVTQYAQSGKMLKKPKEYIYSKTLLVGD